MIKVEGFMAFHGDMKITPKNPAFGGPYVIEDKDWLYKPEHQCWYGAGRSFPAEVCEVVKEY